MKINYSEKENNQQKIKYFIKSKIHTYLKNRNYSSRHLEKKLLLLPLKYPNHAYYPQYSKELIKEVIQELEENKVINNLLFAQESYNILSFKAWSNQKIWDYLNFKLLFDKNILKEIKRKNPDRDETEFIPEIIRKLKIKIPRWSKKRDQYELKNRIYQELLKDKFTNTTIEIILNKLTFK